MFPIVSAGDPLERMPLPAFVVARDGLYLRKRSLLGLSQTKVERVAHLPTEKEFLDYALPRLSSELMGQVVGFFRAVYRLHRTEAIVLLAWRDGSFELLVPRQRVTSASVRHELKERDVPAGVRLVGSIHSHGAFGAGASSIDEDDEAEFDGLHLVVGDLDRRRPSYSAALAVDGRRFAVRLRDVAERPARRSEPPADWLERVKLQPPPRSTPRAKLGSGEVSTSPPRGSVLRPSHAELDAALARADKLADALGYRLSYRLVPVSPPREPEGRGDA